MAYQFNNITVLIVESTHAMFDLTKSVLDTFGVGTIVSAYDNESGFAEFCKHKPDLVILDWLGGPSNGLELTRRIRQDDQSPTPYVPIIMMTGFSQKKRVIMARDSGITEFIVKPFTAHTLYKRIERIIEQPRQFVRSNDFFGPDRRRQELPFTGTERRGDSREEEHQKAAQTAQEIRARNHQSTTKTD